MDTNTLLILALAVGGFVAYRTLSRRSSGGMPAATPAGSLGPFRGTAINVGFGFTRSA